MSLIGKLLRKNMSPARVAGFLVSNFIGLAIIVAGLQFYLDARSIWEDEDSFMKKDYLVVNKKITTQNTLGDEAGFMTPEIADIKGQPWVRQVGIFTSADFHVSATMTGSGGRSLSTSMFLESIPDEYIDVSSADWHFDETSKQVPIIISKDYLTLYNFGFASSAGMPQLTEGLMSSIPMTLTLSSDRGGQSVTLPAHISGYSNRLNTILVPQSFMDAMNMRLGSGSDKNPSRIIIDTNSPGDVAITDYLDTHGLELAGDKSASQASFLLKVVTGIILAVGVVITLLSFFILMLSISLLMEKNRDKLHALIQLGYPLSAIAKPYHQIILLSACGAYLLSLVSLLLMRAYYIDALKGLVPSDSNLWASPVVGLVLTVLIVVLNDLAVSRKVSRAFEA